MEQNQPTNLKEMRSENKASAKLEELHQKSPNRRTIVCAEDDQVQRLIARSLIEKAIPGFEVIAFESCDEAYKAISGDLRGKVALIFTDFNMMQGRNGLLFAVSLKILGNQKVCRDMTNVPIILNSDEERFIDPDSKMSEALEAFKSAHIIDAHIKKPLGVEQIIEAVFEAVSARIDELAKNKIYA